jgi:hypothetical protein
MSWHALGPAKFPAGAPVTAIHPRTEEGATSLFVTDATGEVWTNFWPAPNSEAGLSGGHIAQWAGWYALGPAKFPAGALVTAIHPRTDEGAITLFAIAKDGKVWSNFWPTTQRLRTVGRMGALPSMDETPQWSGWFAIGDRTFCLGGQVSALHARSAEGALSLYAVAQDNDGVWSATWPASDKSDQWSDWGEVGTKSFPRGTPVTALHPRVQEGAASLFAVGADGRVWTSYWPSAPDQWSDWYPIGDRTFPRWASVTPLHSRSTEGATSIFVIGEDGRVWTTYWPVSA